jgi:hypothetical protein
VLIQHSVYHFFDNSYLLDCWQRFPAGFARRHLDDTQPNCGATFRELRGASAGCESRRGCA